MRELVAHLFVSLDGVAVVDAVVDAIVELRDSAEVLDDFFGKVADEDAMLLGRVTYEEWAEYWPTSDDEPFASHINAVPKFVVSRSLESAPWGGGEDATIIADDLDRAIAELKQRPGKNIGVHGSPTLVESLLQADLLDKLRLEIYPVLAGTGARLFRDNRPSRRLRLLESLVSGNGVAVLTYGCK